MINIKEYKGLTAQDVCDKTGLPNPYSDQTKYSLARQLELMLRDAQKNNVLHLVPKTQIITKKSVQVMKDKGLTILKMKEEEEIAFTSRLDLNSIPHKVEIEKGYRTIIVQRNDIPMNVQPHPSKPYTYNVRGILTDMKCYHAQTLYKDGDVNKGRIGLRYRFGYGTHIALHILD